MSADITTAEQQCGKSKNNIAPVPKETGLKSLVVAHLVDRCSLVDRCWLQTQQQRNQLRESSELSDFEQSQLAVICEQMNTEREMRENVTHIAGMYVTKLRWLMIYNKKTEQALTRDMSDFDQSVLWECCNSVTYEQT